MIMSRKPFLLLAFFSISPVGLTPSPRQRTLVTGPTSSSSWSMTMISPKQALRRKSSQQPRPPCSRRHAFPQCACHQHGAPRPATRCSQGAMPDLPIRTSFSVSSLGESVTTRIQRRPEDDNMNVGAVLAQNGYATGFVGKYHVGPEHDRPTRSMAFTISRRTPNTLIDATSSNSATKRSTEVIKDRGFTWAERLLGQYEGAVQRT